MIFSSYSTIITWPLLQLSLHYSQLFIFYDFILMTKSYKKPLKTQKRSTGKKLKGKLPVRGMGVVRKTGAPKLDTRFNPKISLNAGNIDPSASPSIRADAGLGNYSRSKHQNPFKLQKSMMAQSGPKSMSTQLISKKLGVGGKKLGKSPKK